MRWLSSSIWLFFISLVIPITCYAISVDEALVAIKQVESNGNPYAIRDNTGNRSYFPKSLGDAIGQAKQLLALGHNIDMGMYQINSMHLGGATSADTIFLPATQAAAAAKIFGDFYSQAKSIYGNTELALLRAIGAYNGGNWALYRDNVTYVSKVMAALGLPPDYGNRGTWSQGVAPRKSNNRFQQAFTELVTPSGWHVGEEMSTDPDDSTDPLGEESNSRIVATIIIICVVVFLVVTVKLGLFWMIIRWVIKKAFFAAVRQMFKGRSAST